MNIITKMTTFGEPTRMISGIICGVLLTAYSSCVAGWSVSSNHENNYWLFKACDVATHMVTDVATDGIDDCIMGALDAHAARGSHPHLLSQYAKHPTNSVYMFGFNLEVCNEKHSWKNPQTCLISAIHKLDSSDIMLGLCSGIGEDSGLFDECLICVMDHIDTPGGVLFGDHDHSFTGNYDYCGCKEDHGLVTFSKKTDCELE